jgi:ABC-2 type transport system ATP-binding protein
MTAAAIHTTNLPCRYGRTEAVTDLTLTVREGSLVALLGPNGAGKTTTIRALMNILRPSSGSATVLGVDSTRLGPSEFRAIGHVSESQKLPSWMTVAQLLAFCRPLYPSWDEGLCRALTEQFELPLNVKIIRLSRGMRAKAALVSSLAYRPRLLLLDEPFSGLDPVVREDLVRGVLTLAGQERWTVLISSHDLDEVERLVDEVAFLDGGHLVLSEPLADLHGRFRLVEVTMATPPSLSSVPQHWIGIETAGRIVRFVETRYKPGEFEQAFEASLPGGQVDVRPMTLREIFIAFVRQQREARR